MRVTRVLTAFAIVLGGIMTGSVVTAGPAAAADACTGWYREMRVGMSGADVTALQIRVAGWTGSTEVLSVDGNFGSRTENAVKNFQAAYGLSADGQAGPMTQAKLLSLQDSDCTPIHFSYSEMDNDCHSDFTGGKVSRTAAMGYANRVMWKLEALRHKLGDRPLDINSGFRDIACNSAAGGASDSMHLYGAGADLSQGAGDKAALCAILVKAKSSGFSSVQGPGYAGHNDHVHVDIRMDVSSSRGTFFPSTSC